MLETLESVLTFVTINNLFIYNHFSKVKERRAIGFFFFIIKKNHVLVSWPEEINYDILYFSIRKEYKYVGSQIVAHTLIETGNGPNRPNTIDL